MNLNFQENEFKQFIDLFEKLLKVYNVPYKKLDNFFISTENIKLSPIELKIKSDIKRPLDQTGSDLIAFTDTIQTILEISQVVNVIELMYNNEVPPMTNMETQLCNITEFLSCIFMSELSESENKDLDDILKSININKMA